MERSKVVCHMMTSIDGKIDGEYMNEKGSNFSGVYYDNQIWKIGTANGNGRTTAQMYFANAEIDYSKYKNIEIEYLDYIVESDYYWIVFDRKGSCNWNTNKVTYGGKTANVVMILTQKVPKEYLVHLKKLNISYIFAGEEEIDFKLVLAKLKEKYKIDTLVLCGGAVTNGTFHEKDLIDEISLVVAPYVEGKHELKGIVELNNFENKMYKFKSANALEDGGVHLIFKK